MAQLERLPRFLRHPGVPQPGSSSDPRSQPSWEVSTCYRGPELYNYHGRQSYFGKRLCCCQSFYSSKAKQDGKIPAQDAASGGRGELNLLSACTGAAAAPAHSQHHLHPGRAWGWPALEGSKEVGGERFGVTDTTGCQPGMGGGWGQVQRPHASAVRISIFSSFSCSRCCFGVFPVPCAWSGAPRCCSQ